MSWIELSLSRVQWQTFADMVINLHLSLKSREYLDQLNCYQNHSMKILQVVVD